MTLLSEQRFSSLFPSRQHNPSGSQLPIKGQDATTLQGSREPAFFQVQRRHQSHKHPTPPSLRPGTCLYSPSQAWDSGCAPTIPPILQPHTTSTLTSTAAECAYVLARDNLLTIRSPLSVPPRRHHLFVLQEGPFR